MGKSGRKWKESVPMSTVIDAINSMPVKQLLPAAKVVCGTDYAVRFYNNKKHPKFYHNDEGVRHALRRCVTVGAFEHRATVIRYLGLGVSNADDWSP